MNGFGGAGGGFLVTGTTVTAVVPPNVAAGGYQVRVIATAPPVVPAVQHVPIP